MYIKFMVSLLAYLSICGQKEQTAPLSKYVLHRGHERLGVGNELQIRVKQSERGRAEEFIGLVDAKIVQRVRLCRSDPWGTDQGNVISENIDRGFRALECVALTTSTRAVRVDSIFSGDQYITRLFIQGHTPETTTGIFEDSGRLTLPSPGNYQRQYPIRC